MYNTLNINIKSTNFKDLMNGSFIKFKKSKYRWLKFLTILFLIKYFAREKFEKVVTTQFYSKGKLLITKIEH